MLDSDPFDLARFVQAQGASYDVALAEVSAGRKRSHWMWYIFPQALGLGYSAMSRRYGIRSPDEARAFLSHPILGPRLIAITDAALRVQNRSAREIFGRPDDLKLRSCATLFAAVSPPGSVFQRLLDRYFDGQTDPETLRLLGLPPEPPIA